jgi:ribosomal protein S18 acetylase RimI-like enzyme
VSSASATLRPTIDRRWLERRATADPILHAYALWDLDRHPDQVRFVSAVRADETLGYLLIWLGARTAPIVHWFDETPEARALLGGFPPRPFVAVVPEGVRGEIEREHGPVGAYPLLILSARPENDDPNPEATPAVRHLTGSDRGALLALTTDRSELVASEYPHLNPDRELIWGYFGGARLCGVARAVVRLPHVWLLSGVFVDPAQRGRGVGLALVRAALAEARAAGVVVGLYVREDRPAARAAYERAGFRPHARRVWLDAGTGGEP